jgi:hypothetical protein
LQGFSRWWAAAWPAAIVLVASAFSSYPFSTFALSMVLGLCTAPRRNWRQKYAELIDAGKQHLKPHRHRIRAGGKKLRAGSWHDRELVQNVCRPSFEEWPGVIRPAAPPLRCGF